MSNLLYSKIFSSRPLDNVPYLPRLISNHNLILLRLDTHLILQQHMYALFLLRGCVLPVWHYRLLLWPVVVLTSLSFFSVVHISTILVRLHAYLIGHYSPCNPLQPSFSHHLLLLDCERFDCERQIFEKHFHGNLINL